ncbi:MAG: UDP-galactopyranose mutase [Candidatus Taylorbacteria bacterium]|nr:UDP-galactopyranose mutase [Candidatus Taylorbacteria bacterium]
MIKYDYLIVGAGLFGATFAYQAKQAGKRCLVIDKRSHLGGNVYCENIEGINVHKYGAHIFHTSNQKVWYFVNSFIPFNRYTHSVLANYKGKIYNLPFNMNTFYQLWKTVTPKQAKDKIKEQTKKANFLNPKNLKEQALSLVGNDIYKKLIEGYTEKQWGRKATELPSFIIKRLPVRFTYDNNYYNDLYQGIPIGGYNKLIEGMLKDIDFRLCCNFFDKREELTKLAKNIVFTGRIDEYYDFKYGKLEYRSLRFVEKILKTDNFQGHSVINYTDKETPFTRIIEHKHFEFGTQPKTVITEEYPLVWKEGREIYYPINDERNNALYEKYRQISREEKNVIFGGRLAEYKYYDMNQIIEKVLNYKF